MQTIKESFILFYIQREERAIQVGTLDRRYLVDMLKGAPEGTITQIIFERLLLDNIRAEMITGKIVMIKPSRVLAIVLARAFKEHFLAQEEQKWERV